MTEINKRLQTLISPTVEHMGYDVVRVSLMGTSKAQTLQIMAEPKDLTKPMTVEDCELISRALSALLDVEDPISANYMLEVSSPGIDRPLTRLADYDRFKGHLATVELRMPTLEGRKRFQGDLLGTDGGNIRLRAEDKEEFDLEFDNIAKARLVLTDRLIEATIKEHSAANDDDAAESNED